jgi:hypothetical protein
MTRIARLFFIIAVMSAAGSCSIELAEKEADTKAMGRQLTDAYYSLSEPRSRRSDQQWSTAIGNRAGFYGLQNRGIEASSI